MKARIERTRRIIPVHSLDRSSKGKALTALQRRARAAVALLTGARIFVGAVGLAFVLGGCDMIEGSKVLDKGDDAIEVVEVEDVRDHSDRYMGKTVTLMGEVDEVDGPRAFTLEELDLFFEENILVVSKSDILLAGAKPAPDDALRVEGTVRKLGDAELSRPEYAQSLSQTALKQWKGKPVIVANEIVAVYDYAHWSEAEDKKTLTSITDFMSWPSAQDYDGDAVDFDGVQVQTMSEDAVWVGPTAPGVKVVPEQGAILEALRQGDRVDVEGEIEAEKTAHDAAETFVRATAITKSQS